MLKALSRVVVVAAMAGASAHAQSLDDAQNQFYNGRYEASAAQALSVRTADPDNLAASELRSSALLFQLKRMFGEFSNKDSSTDKAWKQCAACPAIMSEFLAENAHGQTVARARLENDPADEAALFYLGKLDLNYVWLQLGVMGRRTGWNEYREARRSMDTVLERNPQHVRARTARAWIEYIVDTRAPFGFAWILGGGSKRRALQTLAAAAADPDAEHFDRVEAEFALWEMQVSERNVPAATAIARRLADEFPENRELKRFLDESGK